MGSSDEDQVRIPIIDISDANPQAPEQLLEAAYQFGFVFVANNDEGIEPSCIAKMFDLATRFFALPVEMKQAVSISSNKAGKNHGWLSQGVEKLDPATQQKPDVKEYFVPNIAFNMGEPVNGQFEQPLPALIEDELPLVLAFQQACHQLCNRILMLFATAIDIEKDWFTSRHDSKAGPSGTVFRLLYYPKKTTKETEVDIRAGAHSDYGSVTCLFQLPGQPGLEIKTPSGAWAAVPVSPDASNKGPLPILVNIGDLLEDWTCGLLKSTVHRVVFPAQEAGDRYSIAYFSHPNDDALLEPVPSKLVEEHAKAHGTKSGKVITAKDHLMERLAATYNVK